ncbi:MAG TPA: hypothetical protein VIN03_16615 [Roseateles sp.]
MTEYDNTNRGVLFVNDRKQRDSQPDRTGTLNVEGVEYFLDGWLKTSQGGKQFLSVSVKRKEKQHSAPPAPSSRTHGDRPGGPKNRPAPPADYDDSDIPF